jgi:hypothetical protein
MPAIDLDDDELGAVIAALKEKLDRDRYPRAPRLEPFRAGWQSSFDPASAELLPIAMLSICENRVAVG